MADHLVTGLTEVAMTCGNGQCGKRWRQPIFVDERLGWYVCPHCSFAAPVNFAYELLDAYESRDSSPTTKEDSP